MTRFRAPARGALGMGLAAAIGALLAASGFAGSAARGEWRPVAVGKPRAGAVAGHVPSSIPNLTAPPAGVLASHGGTGPPPRNLAPPAAAGRPEPGSVVTAVEGGWSNASSFSYRWLWCEPGGEECSAIPGATSWTYGVGERDAGRALRLEVTARNAAGAAAARSAPALVGGTEARTTAAAPRAAPGKPPQKSAPRNTAPPAITGEAGVGKTLTASAGSWSGSPASFRYRWLRCGASGSSCAAVAGATATAYAVTGADVGRALRVEVTAANAFGSATALSAPAAPGPDRRARARGQRGRRRRSRGGQRKLDVEPHVVRLPVAPLLRAGRELRADRRDRREHVHGRGRRRRAHAAGGGDGDERLRLGDRAKRADRRRPGAAGAGGDDARPLRHDRAVGLARRAVRDHDGEPRWSLRLLRGEARLRLPGRRDRVAPAHGLPGLDLRRAASARLPRRCLRGVEAGDLGPRQHLAADVALLGDLAGDLRLELERLRHLARRRGRLQGRRAHPRPGQRRRDHGVLLRRPEQGDGAGRGRPGRRIALPVGAPQPQPHLRRREPARVHRRDRPLLRLRRPALRRPRS